MPEHRHPYGWSDFDPEIVDGLVENDSRFVNRRPGGFIACPLQGHYDDRLRWREDNFKKGSVPRGDPAASFRAAPTYVLERPLDNVIAGRELIGEAIAGAWGKTEVSRLGNELSEGALAWNVLRSLQEAGSLHVAAELLSGADSLAEPELCFWRRQISLDGSAAWAELSHVRALLEPEPGQSTEPTACLSAPGWGQIVIDARFGGSATTVDDPSLVGPWLAHYAAACPGLFDEEMIRNVRLRDFPERLLRLVAFARTLKGEGEHAMVVTLVRQADETTIERQVSRCLAEAADVGFRQVSWESLYDALDPADDRLAPLRRYLENKSYGLRAAFALQDEDPA